MSDVVSAQEFNDAFRRAEANLNLLARDKGVSPSFSRLPVVGEMNWAPVLAMAMTQLANLTVRLAT